MRYEYKIITDTNAEIFEQRLNEASTEGFIVEKWEYTPSRTDYGLPTFIAFMSFFEDTALPNNTGVKLSKELQRLAAEETFPTPLL